MEHGGDVVSVSESMRGHQPREQRVHVVVAGLGAAQLGSERPERV